MSAKEYRESPRCIERRRLMESQVEVHKHGAILFTHKGNWSCLCGATGTHEDDPRAQSCTLIKYGAFYEPTRVAA